jgi:hypothetical protein
LEVLTLETLKAGMHGLSPVAGAYLAEAAGVCLSQFHQSGIKMDVDGDFVKTFRLVWANVDDQQRRTHADLQDATEFGASGIGILLARILTGNVVVKRSWKGTGFDYWLAPEAAPDDAAGPFQGSKARLEISGILRGDKSQIRSRISIKLAQTKPTDRTGLPAFVAVVEFATPTAGFVSKKQK